MGQRLVAEIARQAAGIAYTNDFYLLGASTLIALPLIVLLRGRRRPPAASVAAAELSH